ncbi:hypothetical protein [Streptomyces sp. TR02-1]|uniref:SCO2583 family membrane protein n=1 Tax=Streptomyces sp. TR02-1 TaxID=3385977 RepID=UPI0039A22953
MAGREKPPEGPLDEGSGGGDDEYRSLVFDESFVDAARLQEYSAQERLADEEHAAVRSRTPAAPTDRATPRSPSRQGLALVLLIVVAFGTAVYLGVRNPLPEPAPAPATAARMSIVPLSPRGTVPGAAPQDLYDHSPAKDYRIGADGVTLPSSIRRTDHFSANQVLAALTGAKEYVVTSSLDPAVLTSGEVRPVQTLLDPGQQGQFELSIDRPRDDGHHAPAGWMVRFDPDSVALATPGVRVEGTLDVTETGDNALEVVADHVFVYALRPAGSDARADASLFTVRRAVRFHFAREDLTQQQLRVRSVAVQAGPMACAGSHAATLAPLLAGRNAPGDRPPATDPYDRGSTSRAAVCGVLPPSAQPSPVGSR